MTVAADRAVAVPAFRIFLVARAISWVGNAITLVAVPMLVLQLTGSPALTGMTAAAEAVPYLVFGLLAGALADRWNRKRVLVVTGAASGAAMATIPLAAGFGWLHVAHVFVVAIAVSSLFVFFDAAGFGALPEIVGKERIASATGTMVAFSTVIGLAGPAVGGVLAAYIGASWAIGVDAIAYLVAALITARVAWDARPAPGPEGVLTVRKLIDDIGAGIGYIWRTSVVRWLTLIGAGASISGGAMLGLMVVVGVKQLGMTDDDPRFGLLYSATALGAFLISLLVSWIQRKVATGWVTIVALAISWVAQIAWAFTTTIQAGIVVLAVFQAASILSIMNGIIVRQSLAPDHLQSRVNTTARMIAWGGTPIGAALAGILAEYVNSTIALVVCSLGTGLALSLALASGLWRIPKLAVLRRMSEGRGTTTTEHPLAEQ